jgi:hypothetical protein
MKIKYKNVTAEVSGEKPTTCECCGNTPKPRGLQFHHWRYKYTTKEVKERPELALEETSVLCFFCHRIANCIRILEENPDKVKRLEQLRATTKTR